MPFESATVPVAHHRRDIAIPRLAKCCRDLREKASKKLEIVLRRYEASLRAAMRRHNLFSKGQEFIAAFVIWFRLVHASEIADIQILLFDPNAIIAQCVQRVAKTALYFANLEWPSVLFRLDLVQT